MFSGRSGEKSRHAVAWKSERMTSSRRPLGLGELAKREIERGGERARLGPRLGAVELVG